MSKQWRTGLLRLGVIPDILILVLKQKYFYFVPTALTRLFLCAIQEATCLCISKVKVTLCRWAVFVHLPPIDGGQTRLTIPIPDPENCWKRPQPGLICWTQRPQRVTLPHLALTGSRVLCILCEYCLRRSKECHGPWEVDQPCTTEDCKIVAAKLSSMAISCQSSLTGSSQACNPPGALKFKDKIQYPNGWTKERGLEEDSGAVPCWSATWMM